MSEKSAVPPVPISEKYTSSTVAMLIPTEQPPAECVCAHCVSSQWITLPPSFIKCFCHKMRVIVWETSKFAPITRCDHFSDEIQKPDEN